MTPREFVDLVIARGSGIAAPVIAGAVLQTLHPQFASMERRFAIALPNWDQEPFARLRVFAQHRNDLDQLVSTVSEAPVIRSYATITYPRSVPEKFNGRWLCFRRYRIPSRKAERKPEGTLRIRRMREADTNRLPYFLMRSASTRQGFSLYVDVRECQPVEDCLPDNYGLAVSSRLFGLPDLS